MNQNDIDMMVLIRDHLKGLGYNAKFYFTELRPSHIIVETGNKQKGKCTYIRVYNTTVHISCTEELRKVVLEDPKSLEQLDICLQNEGHIKSCSK